MITNVIEECVNDVFLSVCVNRSKFKTVLIFFEIKYGKINDYETGDMLQSLLYIIVFIYKRTIKIGGIK